MHSSKEKGIWFSSSGKVQTIHSGTRLEDPSLREQRAKQQSYTDLKYTHTHTHAKSYMQSILLLPFLDKPTGYHIFFIYISSNEVVMVPALSRGQARHGQLRVI